MTLDRGRSGKRTDIVDREPKAEAYRGEVLGPEAAPPVIERLHALVRKGYRPEIGAGAATDRIVLRHPGRAPDLVLHADGTVEGLEVDGAPHVLAVQWHPELLTDQPAHAALFGDLVRKAAARGR